MSVVAQMSERIQSLESQNKRLRDAIRKGHRLICDADDYNHLTKPMMVGEGLEILEQALKENEK